MPHLLLVDDDVLLRRMVVDFFGARGYSVTAVETGREMIAVLERERIDLVLLDLGLPDEDGLALARRLRTHSKLPLIVLTSRDSRDHRLAALKIGADGYLLKPCDLDEVELRVRNLLRRVADSGEAHRFVQFGDWNVDIDGHVATHLETGRLVTMTPAELRLLTAFLKQPNVVLPRAHLHDAVARGEASSPRLVDVLVSRLRRLFERDPRKPGLIVTVHGAGYKLAGEASNPAKPGAGQPPANR